MELIDVERWLYATLSGDATLTAAASAGVHADSVPATVSDKPDAYGNPPISIIFSLQSPGADDMALDTTRHESTPLYLVRARAKTGKASLLESAARRIDALLHGAEDTIGIAPDPTYKLYIERESPFRLPFLDGNTQYYQLGGLYRCHVLPE